MDRTPNPGEKGFTEVCARADTCNVLPLEKLFDAEVHTTLKLSSCRIFLVKDLVPGVT